MDHPARDMTPLEAAQALDWLIAMGADEIVAETPCNRLDTAVVEVAKTAVAAPLLQPDRAAPLVAVPGGDDATLVAAACDTVETLAAAVAGYAACGLRKSASNCCFLGGDVSSRILVMCDRPRTEEDKAGLAIAGKNAVLLEAMLKAIGLSMSEVMAANFIPWRPPGNRSPSDVEIRQCAPFAARLIALAKPRAILALGGLPGQVLGSGLQSIARQRGTWLAVDGVAMMPTFHPDDLMKTAALKRLAWRDLLMFRAKLDEVAA
jgi:uracil-DNA glycosylase